MNYRLSVLNLMEQIFDLLNSESVVTIKVDQRYKPYRKEVKKLHDSISIRRHESLVQSSLLYKQKYLQARPNRNTRSNNDLASILHDKS